MRGAWEKFDADVGRWLTGLTSIEKVTAAASRAIEAGCHSGALEQLASAQASDNWGVAQLVNAVMQERGLEFPLRDDAISAAANDVLKLMVDRNIELETAVGELRALADNVAAFEYWEDLDFFRGMDISLELDADPDCDYALAIDHPTWREEMLSAARRILARGGVRPGMSEDSD